MRPHNQLKKTIMALTSSKKQYKHYIIDVMPSYLNNEMTWPSLTASQKINIAL